MKKRFWLVLMVVMGVCLLAGCGKKKSDSGEQVHNTENKEKDQMVLGIVTKAGGNRYNELQAAGFQQVIEAAGAKCIVAHPRSTTAREQVRLIEELMEQDVDAITVAANDADALDEVLGKARERKILVTSVDSNVNPEYTSLFINQVDAELVAKTLLDAVLDISGGSGEWAILSSSSMATNQNTWIDAMRELMEEEDKYGNLELVEIAYGEDETQLSKDQAMALLQTYQDLKVICAPTTVGSRAAAEMIAQQESDCRVTGLGLPSEMADYIADDGICPYMYLWNSQAVGQLAAYATLAMAADELSAKEGAYFDAGDLGTFTIQEPEEGEFEVIAGSLLRFSAENIVQWKDIL